MQNILKAGGATAVTDTLGGELISYKLGGREIVWDGQSDFWTGHAPVLFPIVGALKHDEVLIDGRVCSMKKHGFARKSAFEPVEITDKRAVYTLTDSEQTLEQYPYRFRLTITHEIGESGFSTAYTVFNPDDKPIWFCIGGHAGFLLDSVERYHLEFEQAESCKLYYTDADSILSDRLVCEKALRETNRLSLCYDDFDVDVLIAKDLRSRKVRLVNDQGHGVAFDFTGFDALGIWTPPHKRAPFLCLEPWNGLPACDNETGNFEDKPFAVSLAPGKAYRVGYKVQVL